MIEIESRLVNYRLAVSLFHFTNSIHVFQCLAGPALLSRTCEETLQYAAPGGMERPSRQLTSTVVMVGMEALLTARPVLSTALRVCVACGPSLTNLGAVFPRTIWAREFTLHLPFANSEAYHFRSSPSLWILLIVSNTRSYHSSCRNLQTTNIPY